MSRGFWALSISCVRDCQPGLPKEDASIAHGDGKAAADLDIPMEDVEVAKADVQRRDGHDLGDRAEVEDALVPQQRKVVENVYRVLEGVDGHRAERVSGLCRIFGQSQLFRMSGEASPDLFRPKHPSVIHVFSEVAENVGLLQEEAHRVAEDELATDVRRFSARSGEETREALADDTGDIVTVEIEVFERLDRVDTVVVVCEPTEARHAVAHLLRDVGNHDLVSG